MIGLLMAMGFTKFNLIRQDDFAPVRIPVPGGLAHVKWSLRQWIRLQLRKHPGVLGALRKLKPNKEGTATKSDGGGEAYAIDSAGPTPMEFKGDWYSPAEFLWLWQNVVHGGTIESAWFDIHAAR
jgi:hypothetical protein